MKQTEINTLKNLISKMIKEIDDMDDDDIADTFSEYSDKYDIKNTVYDIVDYIIDNMPVED